MGQFFKKLISHNTILAVLMIGLTGTFVHGLSISRLGYYYDDWYMLWSGSARGATSLIALFGMDRPFMGVIYSGLYGMIGENIWGWHVAALLARIAGAIAFWKILDTAWPKLKHIAILAAMLFIVFPGFLAEPNAATKINHLLGYGGALFSILLTLLSVKADRKALRFLYLGLSMLLLAFYAWIYEYMIGLEVMRLVLVYWMQIKDGRTKGFAPVKKVLLTYMPYLAVIGLFLFWRVFIFESTRNATDLRGLVSEYQSDFLGMVIRLLFQTLKDFLSATVFAWFVQLYHLMDRAIPKQIVTAMITALGMVLLTIGYLYLVRKSEAEGEDTSPFTWIWIGSLVTLAAVFPVVLSNRHLDLMDAYKGYALHPSAGVMIMVVGVVMMLKPRFRQITLIALIGFSVMVQSMNVQRWANFWEIQKDFWWQLTWRAPDIQDDTLVMAYLPDGYVFQQDYEIWGPVNLIYRPDVEHYPLIQSEVLNQNTLLDVAAGTVSHPYVRDIYVPRNYQNLLLISQPTTASCIHLIDGTMPAYSTSERLIVEKAGGFSDINRVVTSGTPPLPPAAIFGPEPEHGWCYYYQQAALSRQRGAWSQIGAIYDETLSLGLKPADASEYFVFIEGLVNMGRTDEAQKIANDLKENGALKYSLCSSLAAAPAYPAAFGYELDQIDTILCK